MATVPMTRNAEQYPAPHSADVHPDEVENYRAAGFEPVEAKPAPKKAAAKKGAK